MPYATADDLQAVASLYELPVPSDDAAVRLLTLAARDLDRFMGTTYEPVLETLVDEQRDALRDACAMQAAFRIVMGPEAMLGVDDGIASAGNVSFSLRPLPRFSVEAAERLSGLGLIVRAPMAADPPAA